MTGLPRVFDPSAAITIRGARVHNLQGIDLEAGKRDKAGKRDRSAIGNVGKQKSRLT